MNIQEYLHRDSEHMMLLRFLRSSSSPASEQPAGNSASPLNGYVGVVIANTPGSWIPLLLPVRGNSTWEPTSSQCSSSLTSEKSPARRWGKSSVLFSVPSSQRVSQIKQRSKTEIGKVYLFISLQDRVDLNSNTTVEES